MYSDFYEIPLPALRFEKVEETDTKWTNTEENDAFLIDQVRRTQEIVRNDAQQRKADSLAGDDTQRNSKRFQNNVNKRFQTTKPMTLTKSEQRIWR